MSLPNFIIAGATRSGTTSLYYYLNQHPEIGFPTLKEPRYFSSIGLTLPQMGPGDNTVDENLVLDFHDYVKLYDNVNSYKRIGDASSEYLYHYDYSAESIYNTLGDIPIIIILRNPVERAFSAYNNLVRDGREKRSFEEGLMLEAERIDNNWDMMWAYKSVGLYCRQVRKYLQVFSNVHIILFEEFINDVERHLQLIYKFLDVSINVNVDTSVTYSYSGAPKSSLLGLITSRNNKYLYPLRKAAINFFSRAFLEKISRRIYSKSFINENVRNELNDFYLKDVICLEGLLSRDLSIWGIK